MFNHDDYINTNDFNKFSGTIIDERLKVMKGASSCKHRQAINTMQCAEKLFKTHFHSS